MNALALVCAFALGVLVRDQAQDYQRGATLLPAAERGAVIDPAPALHQTLQFPLCNEGGWVASCVDGRECRFACLGVLRVDDAAAPSLKSQRNLKDIPQRAPQRALILRPSQ